MSNIAPVILFVYNRPEHTQKVLDALAENILAKDSELFIFCDGPKNEDAIIPNNKTKRVVEIESKRDRFKSVFLNISDKNKGLAASIISGVTQIIERYGKCIVLEDDHITSKSFLVYMNQCLEFYEMNPLIWSISGFTYPLKTLYDYPHDVYLSYRACSHGWATWKDRWSKVDWMVKDFEQLQKSLRKQRKFNRGGNDLYRMLRHQIRGERDSWAIRFCYSQSKNDMLTIYPKFSLIRNIGFDGSGTHCQATEQQIFDNFISEKFDFYLEDISLEKKVTREFKYQYRITFLEACQWLLRKFFDLTKRN